MRFINEWWGVNESIDPLEIAARSAAMFVMALLLIRIAACAHLGKANPSMTSSHF